MRIHLLTVIAVGLLAVSTARAQDDAEGADEIEAALADEMLEADASIRDDDSREPLPEIGEDRLQKFVLSRGFFVSSALGTFETLGGTQGFGNIQPFVSVKMGYDISDFIAVQALVSHAYNSGNPWTANDAPGFGGAETANFGMFSVGAEVQASYRPTERFAVEPHIGGGYTTLTPALTGKGQGVDALDTRVGGGVLINAGIDFTYLTLLTDFSAGLMLNYQIIDPAGLAVMGIGQAFVVRYTF